MALLLSCGLFTTTVPAQVNEAFADLAGEIETARSMAQTERKSIVARNMTLTAAESEHFWPLYNRYRYEMSVLPGSADCHHHRLRGALRESRRYRGTTASR